MSTLLPTILNIMMNGRGGLRTKGFGLSRRRDIGAGWNYAKDNTSVYRSYESAVWHGLENDRASTDRAGVASTSNQRVGMRAPKSWALELPMAAAGYWKGNRAGGGARSIGDRVTSLCHSNVVLPPDLAQEQPSFIPTRWSWGCISAVDSRGRTSWIARRASR